MRPRFGGGLLVLVRCRACVGGFGGNGIPVTLPSFSPQTERAYQKQPTIFQNKKRVLLGEGGKEKLPRYYKNIGLGFKTPKEAIEGTYIDKKCPFTGNVSIRGRILSGVVTKMKMQRTIVIRRDYLHYIRKYNRFEKRHKNMSVHLSPCFRTEVSMHFSATRVVLLLFLTWNLFAGGDV
uniref:Ribosomal protein S11 n=1 Tax=Apteryx owenii TaxID=8824 RepID=A0A8B9QLX0_APTOW